MKKIAILASGSGTNAENIVKIFHEGNKIRVALVIANRAKAGVHQRMANLGVPTTTIQNNVWDNDPQQIVALLKENEIDLVVLAGFMHRVDSVIIEAFKNRIINIHPSLLPAYGGVGMYGHHVHEAVIANGEKQSGVTVHYVTEEIDGGEILMQQVIDLEEGETAESLEAKVHPVEYDLYPRAIVAAISRIEAEEQSVADTKPTPENTIKEELQTPPSIDEQWANVLGITYDKQVAEKESNQQVPPPLNKPQQLPPPIIEQQTISTSMPQEPMPPTYLVFAVLATILCCTPLGIVALIYSSRVSSKYYMGDIDGAKQASKIAQRWIIASFVVGLLWVTLYVPIMIIKTFLIG